MNIYICFVEKQGQFFFLCFSFIIHMEHCTSGHQMCGVHSPTKQLFFVPPPSNTSWVSCNLIQL